MTTADPPLSGAAGDDWAVPTVVLGEHDDEMLAALRQLQTSVVKHPAAAQAMFQYLSAEGRRYQTTPAGQAWEQRLRQSRLVRQLGLVFDLSTISLLDRDPPGALPTQLLDVLFTLSAIDDSDALLDRLFRWEGTRHE
jgi:hypothetical protein